MTRPRFAARLALAVPAILGLSGVTASATPPQSITIETSREQGSPGTFSVSGAVADEGTFTTVSIHFSAVPAPDFVIVHATYRFVGGLGSFTLRVQITETLTDDPNVLIGNGTWVLHGGTGAYAGAHAEGEIHGTVDATSDPELIFRTYTGSFHVD